MYHGRRYLDADWISKRLTQHRKQARLASGTLHSLRHIFITYALALGIPESLVMAMTGHTKYDTVRRYTHMVDELLQEAPAAALAWYLPGYDAGRKLRLTREIAALLAAIDDISAVDYVDLF